MYPRAKFIKVENCMIYTRNIAKRALLIITSTSMFFLLACGSDSNVGSITENLEQKLIGIWETNCFDGGVAALDLRDPQNAVITEKEWFDSTCDGTEDGNYPLTFSYEVGEIFITTDNKEAREFQMTFTFSDAVETYQTIIWIDENGVLFAGQVTDDLDASSVGTRPVSLNYNNAFYKQ